MALVCLPEQHAGAGAGRYPGEGGVGALTSPVPGVGVQHMQPWGAVWTGG